MEKESLESVIRGCFDETQMYDGFLDHLVKQVTATADKDRAAMHKEILAVLPKEAKAPDNTFSMTAHQRDVVFTEITERNSLLSAVRKAIDEVFSSKE